MMKKKSSHNKLGAGQASNLTESFYRPAVGAVSQAGVSLNMLWEQ